MLSGSEKYPARPAAYADRCIDQYVELRSRGAEEGSEAPVDERLVAIVERLFERWASRHGRPLLIPALRNMISIKRMPAPLLCNSRWESAPMMGFRTHSAAAMPALLGPGAAWSCTAGHACPQPLAAAVSCTCHFHGSCTACAAPHAAPGTCVQGAFMTANSSRR